MRKTFLYNRIGAIEDILKNYAEVTMTVENIAKKWDVTPRTIQRIVKQHGIVRTISEGNKVTAKLKDYSALRKPDELKARRKSLSRKLRYQVMSSADRCTCCGATKYDNYLQVDHIDGDASNNVITNLQVLCIDCNQGKR